MSNPAHIFDPLPLARTNGNACVPNGHDPHADDGLEHVPVVPPNAPKLPPCRGSARWWYPTPDGQRIMAVDRIEPRTPDERKQILPLTLWQDRAGNLTWRHKQHPAPRPLFGLDRLAARPSAPVLVAEGEKKVEPARRYFPDVEATCSAGGSRAAARSDWAPCCGRSVLIWPDNDSAGKDYARDVARLALAAGALEVHVVDVPQHWPDGWDLADPLPDGVTADDLRRMLANARPVRAETVGGAAGDGGGDTAEIARLARLNAMNYDRERENAAERMGVRVATLDAEVKRVRDRQRQADEIATAKAGNPDFLRSVEPWAKPVDGEALCNAMACELARYVVLPAGAATTVALWCLFAHAHAVAENSPILALLSAEKRSGKTTLLSVVLRLVPLPLPAANISPAAVYRSVEKWGPTLLVDEADSFLRDNEDMRGVLNSGFTAATAFVVKCDGDDNEPRPFSTWCPKLLAGIGRLPDTVQDRSIVVTLRRKLDAETVERFTPSAYSHLDELARRAARWVQDTVGRLKGADPAMPASLHDRQRDCWRPLLAIAEAVGGRWPETARKAAVELSGGSDDTGQGSAGTLLLAHVKELLSGAASIGSTELVERLIARDDWPWCEWRHGRPISARGVARLLAPYGIRPKHGRDGSRYAATAFADPWRRYLPQIHPVASVTSVEDTEKPINNNMLDETDGRFSSVTCSRYVTDDKPVLLNKFRELKDMTLATGEGEDEDIVEGTL